MTRVNLDDSLLNDPVIRKGWKLARMSWTPTTGLAISDTFPPWIEMNPAGAVNILMPASTPARAGLMFLITNPSGSTITFQTDGGAAFATAITLATTQNCLLICTGNPTANLGWRKIPSTAA